MFILSQDKKSFADYTKLYVSKNFSGKNGNKAALLGVENRVFGSTVILGAYRNEEDAAAELENIYEAMKNGEPVYTVK